MAYVVKQRGRNFQIIQEVGCHSLLVATFYASQWDEDGRLARSEAEAYCEYRNSLERMLKTVRDAIHDIKL